MSCSHRADTVFLSPLVSSSRPPTLLTCSSRLGVASRPEMLACAARCPARCASTLGPAAKFTRSVVLLRSLWEKMCAESRWRVEGTCVPQHVLESMVGMLTVRR
jgi:hypothetical protein